MLLTLQMPVVKNSYLERHQNIISLFAALVFLSHPIQTQAVTYIVQRTASLATLFYLLTLFLYVKFRLARKPVYYIFAFITAFLGSFTKEIFITLPFCLLLYELSFFTTQRRFKGIKPLAPFILVIGLILFLTSFPVEHNLGEVRDITRLTAEISRKDYLLTEINVVRTYIRLLFLPVNQNLDYDYPVTHNLNSPTFFSLLLLLSILALGLLLFRRKPLLSFGTLFFFISLSVESSIFPIPDVIFEHRLYLPCFGFSVFLSSLVIHVLKSKKTYIVVCFCLVLLLSVLTYKRNSIWKDEVTLWEDVVKKSPNKARPYNNLGTTYFKEQGKFDEAIKNLKKGLAIGPNYAISYNNLGVIHDAAGKYDKASQYYKKAIELNPDYAVAYINLGLTYSELDQNDEAIKYTLKGIQLNPDYAAAYKNLGVIYSSKEQYKKAIQLYQVALNLEPSSAEIHNNLGVVYKQIGQYQKAIQLYEKAIRLKPEYPASYNNLGNTYKYLRQYQKAIQLCKKAISLDPEHVEAYINLGDIYLELGEFEEVIKYCQRAIDISPEFAEAYYNFGLAYEGLGQYTKAIQYYQQAIEVKPDYTGAYNNLGTTYGKLGQYKEAIKYLEKAVELDPNHAKAYSNLGFAYSFLGQNNKAREYLEGALKLYRKQAESEMARETEEFLKSLP